MRRKGHRAAVILLTLAFNATGPAHAEDAPYEGKMLRLAEILGSLHYLHNLCGETGNEWRTRMDAIIAAEKPGEEERQRLVSSFNHGYRVFSENYARCTPSAQKAIERYMQEGTALTGEIITRYGN